MNKHILRVENLTKNFQLGKHRLFSKGATDIIAVNKASFYVNKGEILGIVGESGCGKTTLGRLLIKLIQPTDGSVFFNGDDVTRVSISGFRKYRKLIQMVFQNPYSSLNPSMTVADQLTEAILLGEELPKVKVRQRLAALLDQVNLSRNILTHYPHQLSGGEARRIGLARILAVKPQVIVLDEPVASLDLSIKSNVIKLLLKLKQQLNLTYIWISHDMEVINHAADRVMVMFAGNIVEIYSPGYTNSFVHPYTEVLLTAAEKVAGVYALWSPIQNLNHQLFEYEIRPQNVTGCVYYSMCSKCKQNRNSKFCKSTKPELRYVKSANKWIACHLAHD